MTPDVTELGDAMIAPLTPDERACRYPRPGHPGLVPVPNGRILGPQAEQDESRGHWGGPARRHSDSYAVARKTHRCLACRQPILAGELHHRVNYGPWLHRHTDPWTCRMCEFCGPRVLDLLLDEGESEWYDWELSEALWVLRKQWLDRLAADGLVQPLLEEDGRRSWEAVEEEIEGIMDADAEEWLWETAP